MSHKVRILKLVLFFSKLSTNNFAPRSKLRPPNFKKIWERGHNPRPHLQINVFHTLFLPMFNCLLFSMKELQRNHDANDWKQRSKARLDYNSSTRYDSGICHLVMQTSSQGVSTQQGRMDGHVPLSKPCINTSWSEILAVKSCCRVDRLSSLNLQFFFYYIIACTIASAKSTIQDRLEKDLFYSTLPACGSHTLLCTDHTYHHYNATPFVIQIPTLSSWQHQLSCWPFPCCHDNTHCRDDITSDTDHTHHLSTTTFSIIFTASSKTPHCLSHSPHLYCHDNALC